MKSTFKSLGASVLALSLALCGYGADWGRHAPFKPMVTKDARVALGVNLDKRQAFKAVDLYADRICTIAKLDAPATAMVKTRIAAYKEDLFLDVPADARRNLKEWGVYDANFRWVVISLGAVNYAEDVPQVVGLSLALAGKFDFEKFLSLVQKRIQEEDSASVTLRKVVVEGEDAWQLAPTDASLVQQWRKVGIDPHATSLDGQLVLASSSRGELAKQIRLYRNGSGGGDALGGFSAREGELVHLTLPSVREFVPQSLVPGDWLGFGGLDYDLTMSPDGKVSETVRVHDGCIVALAPIAMGALFPMISSAMHSADLSTMAIQGRKLVMGIITANIERMGKAGGAWPRTKLDENRPGQGGTGVADRAYKSATDYFNALFDMKHYGQAEWNPCVDGELLSSLWGCGVPGMNGRTLEKANVAWTVAANVTDETPDFVPVLITANFNPALLLRKWDGKTKGSEKLPIGPKSGAQETPLGDKGIVIVRKSGAAETVKKKDLTYNVLYKKQAFDLTKMKPPLMYLTPGGVVMPRECVGALVPGGAPSKEWLNLMACFLAGKGQKERSREMYLKVLEKDAANYDALMGLWRLSLQEGATDEARSYLKKAEKAKTREGVERLEVPLQYMMDNNLDEAHEALKQIVFRQPSARVWALDAGVLLMQADNAKDPADKQRILAEVENEILPKMEQLSDSPRDFYVQMTRALVLMRKGKEPETLTKARDALDDAWRSRPTSVAVGKMVLDLDYRLLDRESAERHAKQILRLAGDHSFANWVMGSIRMNEGKNPEAEQYLRASAQAAHPLPAAQNDLAELLRRRGNLAEAEKFARAATKSDPNLYVAWETLSATLLDRGQDLDEAERCVRKALALPEGKEDHRMQLTLARVQIAKKDFAKARNALRVLDKRRAELEERDRAVLDELQRQVREINGLKLKKKKKQ